MDKYRIEGDIFEQKGLPRTSQEAFWPQKKKKKKIKMDVRVSE